MSPWWFWSARGGRAVAKPLRLLEPRSTEDSLCFEASEIQVEALVGRLLTSLPHQLPDSGLNGKYYNSEHEEEEEEEEEVMVVTYDLLESF